jgi:hypothetical protein
VLAGIGGAGFASGARAALLPAGVRSETHDVVVIGAGTAALVAALQAKQDGADVVVLEKTGAAESGGDSRMSGGISLCLGRIRRNFEKRLLRTMTGLLRGEGTLSCFGLSPIMRGTILPG